MKGDMSLELIVKLLILLVVAAVVISMFLNLFPGNQKELEPGNIGDEQDIKTSCQQVCDRWKRGSGLNSASAAVEYCTKRFSFDADEDGVVSGQFGGNGYNTYCQDGVHCFNLHECTKSYRTLDAETCRQVMCDYYQNPEVVDTSSVDPNNRVEAAFALVAEENRGAGTCDLPNAEDATGNPVNTWWSENNFEQGGNPPC